MRKITFFPEKELLNRIQSNDRTVLGELFVRYERLVSSYVTSHGGDEADAEDMLQEAIIVLWQKVCAGNFELTSKLGTYILAIAKNKWRAEVRKRSRFDKGALSIATPDGNPSSLDDVLEAERLETLRRALEAINPVCKQLLMLFYFEERRLQDIATVLGFANADVAKSKKYQCKKALESVLRKQMAEAERRI